MSALKKQILAPHWRSHSRLAQAVSVCLGTVLLSQMAVAKSNDMDISHSVALYAGSQQSGSYIQVDSDQNFLGDMHFNDRAVSVSIPHGWEVRFFEHGGFSGRYWTRNGGKHELPEKYQISSVQILKKEDEEKEEVSDPKETTLKLAEVKFPEITSGLNAYTIDSQSAIKPRPLTEAKVDSVSYHTIERGPTAGYDINGLTLSQAGNMITVRNNSPRAFKELVITDGIDAYLLDIELGSFQEVRFSQQMTHKPVYIIDPNPQFRSTPGHFKEGTPASAVTNYHLLGNHIKAFYAQPKTQEHFFHFFADRGAPNLEALQKWHTTLTYNVPKEYQARTAPTAGRASLDWLTIGWPMDHFDSDKSYTYIYIVYSHENAHTQGYDHDSGLAYGWDDYVQIGIDNLFSSGKATPGAIIQEQSDVYIHYNKARMAYTFFAKPGVTIDNVEVIGNMDSLRHSGAAGYSYYLDMASISNEPVLLSVQYGNQKTIHITDDIYPITPQVDRNPYYLNLNEESEYAHGVRGHIFYYIPEQQSVVDTDVLRSYAQQKWIAEKKPNKVTVQMLNNINDKHYPVTFLAEKTDGYQLDDGAGKAPFKVTLDEETLGQLPEGSYSGSFDIVAAGWHTNDYRMPFSIQLEFDKFDKDWDRLELDTYSDNYSHMTPSGKSSVYFYVPEQESVISSTGPREESKNLWSGQEGYTRIVVNVVGEDGQTYPLDLLGSKNFFYDMPIKMEDGVQSGFGQVKFSVDTKSDSYRALPKGQEYRTKVLVNGKGWHDSDYEVRIQLNVNLRTE